MSQLLYNKVKHLILLKMNMNYKRFIMPNSLNSRDKNQPGMNTHKIIREILYIP